MILVFFSGCAKKEMGCTSVSPQAEETQITAYASANGITAVKHSSGLYYQVIEGGTGTRPTVDSTVEVSYVGKLLNGKIFDQSTSYKNKLGELIEGWQLGIPLIKEGGKIRLIVPSALAYGCNPVTDPYTGVDLIPANSVLYFDVYLIDVK